MNDNVSTFMIERQYSAVPNWLKEAKRWLVFRLEQKGGPKKTKVPYYVNGRKRSGTLDAEEDVSRLGTFEEAIVACARDKFDGLGFALGKDTDGKFWQGIDLDNVNENKHLKPLVNELEGYVELSPSGNGYHAIGKGEFFRGGRKEVGVEAYSAARFFTVTGKVAEGVGSVDAPVDLKSWLMMREWANPSDKFYEPGANQNEIYTGSPEEIDPQTRADLLSALYKIDGSGYDEWLKVGMALKTLEGGFELWANWSRSWPVPNPPSDEELLRKWERDVIPNRTNWRSIFKQAQDLGWINPASKEARALSSGPQQSTLLNRVPIRGDAIEPVINAAWLVKNVIPRQGIGVVYGAPSSAKTFFALDFTCRYVSETFENWEGNRIRRGSTLQAGYCFLEGGFFAGNRVAAWRKVYDTSLNNLLVFPYPLAFTAAQELKNIIENVKTAGGVDLLVIDTLARAMTGVDENTVEGMSKAIDAATYLSNELNCFVLIIHHTGKDKERGMRGSSSLKGAVDLEIFVDRIDMTEYRTVEVKKVKDGLDGIKTAFKLTVVELGQDQDGDPVTSCVIESCPLEEALDAAEPTEEDTGIARTASTRFWGEDLEAFIASSVDQGFAGCALKTVNGGSYILPKGYENFNRVNLQSVMTALKVRDNNRRNEVKDWLVTKYEGVEGWVIMRPKDHDLSFVEDEE